MATVNKDNFSWRVLFYDAGRKRRTLRLGQIGRRQAEAACRHVELLVDAKMRGVAPPLDTSRWVAGVEATLLRKLAKFGLAEFAEPAVETLGPFLDSYITSRTDVKESTSTVYGHTRRCLIAYFGRDRKLIDITLADAERWRRWLTTHDFPRVHGHKGGPLAKNTANRRCGIARQFFSAAVDDRILAENPFRKLKGVGVKENRSRDFFVTREMAAKVLAACSDAEWRLIFALSRFGGLRCPSEHLELKWADVDWVAGKMLIHASKTEHHEGNETRIIPIFPELRPYLEACFEPEAVYVINRYRDPNSNLRTQLNRIIRRAGLKPWPKLFHNLRATRETELAETFPIHVACKWIGNSKRVAARHYLQVTDDHFSAAVGVPKLAQNTLETRGKPLKSAGRQEEIPENLQLSSTSGTGEWAAQDSKHPRNCRLKSA